MPDHWFEDLADHLGEAYLRYAFTKGTAREVDFLIDVLELGPGSRVLDIGCGPGRHALELGLRGVEVVGVDISSRFIDLGTRAAAGAGLADVSFERADARSLTYDEEFDAAYAMCQGAFGLQGGPARDVSDDAGLDGDLAILESMTRAVRAGGLVGVAAFSAYFQVGHLDDDNRFDAATGVHHERTEIRDPAGVARRTDLWTTCFTARELRLMTTQVGLEPLAVWSVYSGERYERTPLTVDEPELFCVARKDPV